MEESANHNPSGSINNSSEDKKTWYKDSATKINNPPAKVGMEVEGFGGKWKIIEVDGNFVRLENEQKTIEWMNYSLIKFDKVKKWWEFWK